MTTNIFTLFGYSEITPTVESTIPEAPMIPETTINTYTRTVPEPPVLETIDYTSSPSIKLSRPLTQKELLCRKVSLRKPSSFKDNYLDNSWNYVKTYIRNNPRPFNDVKLQKFRDVILDPEFPPIRQKFCLEEEDQVEENISRPCLNQTATKFGIFLGCYFIFLNVVASMYSRK